MLLLLAACAANPGKSGPDDPSADPGVDTADTGPLDTADSGDPSDSGDTADSGDTGTPEGRFSGTYALIDARLRLDAGGGLADLGRLMVVAEVTGDGVNDLVATTLMRGTGGAMVFEGPLAPDASPTRFALEAPTDEYYAGRSLFVGDTTGDGAADAGFGHAYVNGGLTLYSGPITEPRAPASAWAEISGVSMADTAGHGGVSADLDGDGVLDLVVGAYGADTDAINAGAVYLVPGPVGEVTTSLDTLATGRIAGETSGTAFGRFVFSGGDADGDGVVDLLVSEPWARAEAPGAGIVHLWCGSFTGNHLASEGAAQLRGDTANQWAGEEAVMVDLDGDGGVELVVSGVGGTYPRQGGAVYAVAGPFGGAMSLGSAPTILRGDGRTSGFGAGLAAGDLDGDGQVDLAVGATGDAAGGAAWLFYGPQSGELAASAAQASFESSVVGSYFGEGLAIGDLTGDGAPELLVGANAEGGSAGAIYAF